MSDDERRALRPGPSVATGAGASPKRARGYAYRHDIREWRVNRGLLSLRLCERSQRWRRACRYTRCTRRRAEIFPKPRGALNGQLPRFLAGGHRAHPRLAAAADASTSALLAPCCCLWLGRGAASRL